jgi:gliding motility-associated-like protein
MYDMGNTEGGGFSSAQSAVIIPKPGASNHYLLFTMEEVEFDIGGSVPGQPDGRGLSYFDVDMSLNGGLGGVATYTGMAFVPSYEGLCAIRHTNGSDYWILVHNNGSGLAVFPVTANGVGTPVLFNLSTSTFGSIKASPDGKWVNSNNFLFPFNTTNGTVGNPVALTADINSSEFSPDSRRLFIISNSIAVEYYDLTSPDIDASKVTFGQLQGVDFTLGQMQLAPDGKIYFVQSNLITNSTILSTIVCPNTAPFVELDKILFDMSIYNLFFGLPNFDNAIFRRDGDPPLPVNLGNDQSLCNNATLVLNSGINNATYNWSTGAQTQTISVNMAGTYIVTVTALGCGVGIDTIVLKEVNLNLDAGADQTVCKGDSLLLAATSNGAVTWTPANLVSNPNILNPSFTGTSSATLFVTSKLDGCTATDSIQIVLEDKPDVSLFPTDTTINSGTSVQLLATGMGMITWSPATGLSCTDCLNPIATPTETTTYHITLTQATGCSRTDSVTVTVVPPDCSPRLPNAFTPNGDMINNDFKPLAAGIESYNLVIYNRWGQQIFKGDTPWDGRDNDNDAPCDVYIYQTVIQICGRTVALSGEVTLIR